MWVRDKHEPMFLLTVKYSFKRDRYFSTEKIYVTVVVICDTTIGVTIDT